MSFTALLSKMLVLLIFICIGVLCCKLHFIDEHGSAALNKLVLYICGPALIIKSVLNVELSLGVGDVLLLILYSVIMMLLALVIGVVSGRIICGRSPLRGVFSLVTAFGNVFFMGVPVVTALYGESTVFLLSVCVIPFNFFIFSIGIFLLIGKSGETIPWKKLLLNPSLYATIIALPIFFLRLSLPNAVAEVVGLLGQMVVPISMILIGAALGRMALKNIFNNALSYAVCGLKLIVTPLLAFFLLRTFVKDPLILGLLTVVAAMPSASISPILCAEYGGDSAFASRCVFLTTLLSLATVPAMVWLLLLH